MAKKLLFSVLFCMYVMAMAGLAAAEAPISAANGSRGMNYSEMPARQPTADPELQYSNSGPWQDRGPVETGSMPAGKGTSPDLRCCEGGSGPIVDPAGDTVLRHGIDDGP